MSARKSPSSPALTSKALFHGVDHLVVRVNAARPLFEVFSATLGLPVTWPLEQASFATFGWIGLGNANLEIWADAKNADLPEHCPLPLIHGIALAPQRMKSAIAALEEKGVPMKPPRVYRSRNDEGTLQTNFTNVVLPGVSGPTCEVFLCAWDRDAAIVPWQAGTSTTRRRETERAALEAVNGGLLGVTGLRRITIATPDHPTLAGEWHKIRGSYKQPTQLVPDVDVDVVVGEQHVVSSIDLEVRDLAAARDFLADKGLLAERTDDTVMLSPEATGGLAIRLVAPTPAEDKPAAKPAAKPGAKKSAKKY
ncbi:hypothetical protein QTH91_08325 [Variovorax dokdonensis]|uniref:Glyoxalase-like domain-containing protein n=1 Tax=Variovorax dokdonensis TaxID=344883 RepID=A0ABT7N977_9BURK|nr:hypothetical protein [Variovorax dokdonensis]MDM0044481.1 hypothetical protein [Variovorax dokdonensis]